MIQHRQFNSFFFKSIEDFQKYKNNDNMKNVIGLLSNSVIIRFEDENITYNEFKKIFSEYDYILKEGLSNEYIEKRNKRFEKSKKEKDFKEKIKERNKKQNRDFRRLQEEKNKDDRNKKLIIEREKRKLNQRDKKENKNSIKRNNEERFKNLFSN